MQELSLGFPKKAWRRGWRGGARNRTRSSPLVLFYNCFGFHLHPYGSNKKIRGIRHGRPGGGRTAAQAGRASEPGWLQLQARLPEHPALVRGAYGTVRAAHSRLFGPESSQGESEHRPETPVTGDQRVAAQPGNPARPAGGTRIGHAAAQSARQAFPDAGADGRGSTPLRKGGEDGKRA